MTPRRKLGLIVTDASPLITLGAADALDCLLMPGVPVLIPDMVHLEVTRDMARLGAEEVVAWMRRTPELVRLVPTVVFAEHEALLTVNPHARSRGRGEQAALEVLDAATAADTDLVAVLLFEDGDLLTRRVARVLPERVTTLSTGDLLRELEAAGRIQSSDRILEEAAARGRNVERQRTTGRSGTEGAAAVRDSLAVGPRGEGE